MKAQSADGMIHDFPDDTPPEVVDRAMKNYAAEMKKKPMEWSDVGTQAIGNLPSSAAKFATDIASPVTHPVETAKSMGSLALGGLEKGYEGYGGGGLASKALGAINPFQSAYSTLRGLGAVGDTGHAKNVEAVGQLMKDRYGSLENFKRTLAEDPVGVAGDLSIVFTGGETLPGRIGTMSGRVARILDPVHTATVKPLQAASHVVGGLFTHTGAEPLQIAARAGQTGGAQGRAFRENLRGQAPLEETVQAAQKGLDNLRAERGAAYRQTMAQVTKDKTILNFNDIDTALQSGKTTFKGMETNPKAAAVRQQMLDAVEEWKNLQASEFHTPEGFDALKQKLGAIREGTEYGTKARLVANDIYHAVRNTITKQAPEYAKIMKAYEDASTQIRELEKTLSLSPKAAIYTKLRKLQASLRDNVNTSFGRHREMADLLVRAGAPHLMERLAGQALSPWAPRGLAKLGAEIVALKAPALLGVTSPRLMGEAAHKIGQAGRYVPTRVTPYQPGRIAANAPSPREQIQEEAKDALKDRSLKMPKADRETLRSVARGAGGVDAAMKAKGIIDRIDQGFGGTGNVPEITVHPRPQYGGVSP